MVLDVIDDGCGLPPAFSESQGGLGVRLIRALAKQLDSTIDFKPTPHGLHAQLWVPFRSSKDVSQGASATPAMTT